LPSYHDEDYWAPFFRAASEENVVMCLHIGQGFAAINSAPDAPIDNLIILSTQVSTLAAQDLLWGPAFRNYPDLKVAWSEAGIGWIPFYLSRCDRHYLNQTWLGHDLKGKLPSDVFREHSLACYVTDPSALKIRHDIGLEIIAWECDYPHSDSIFPNAPEFVLDEMEGAGVTDDEINMITWQNTCRFFGWDPFSHIAQDKANVGSLRAQAQDVDTTVRSKLEWRHLYEQRLAS
jgi:predicted TIM-barrel fold metal-dependent hydrolase